MKKKTILIAGGGHSEIPLVKAGKRLGYRVIVSGNDRNGLAIEIADDYKPADYSIPAQIKQIAIDEKVDALCAGCNDFSAISSSIVASDLGLPGFDAPSTTLTLHHKDKFREFARSVGIRVPESRVVNSTNTALDFFIKNGEQPIILKPVDMTGGKGISVIKNRDDISGALNTAIQTSRSGRVILEQYINGTNHGVTCIVKNKKVVFCFSDVEHYGVNRFLVGGATGPYGVSDEVEQSIRHDAALMCNSLNLVDGLLHFQIKVHKGTAYIIEVCRRPPGDLYPELVRLSTGIDYPSELVNACLQTCSSNLGDYADARFVTRHCIMGTSNGHFQNIEIGKYAKSRLIESLIWSKRNDAVSSFLTHKFGILFIEHDSLADARHHGSLISEYVKPRIKND